MNLEDDLFWEMNLCTVFPSSLIDKVRGVGALSQSHSNIHPGILSYKHKCERRSHGHHKLIKR